MAASMLVAGVAASVVHPTVYPMITENVRDSNKGKALGLFGSAAKAGDATVPIVVGVLLLVLAWDGIVAVVGGFGVAVGLVLFVLLGRFETAPRAAERDREGPAGPEPDGERDRRAYAYPMFVIYLFFFTRGVAGRGVKTFVPAFVVAVYGYTLTVLGTDFAAESVANFYFSALLFVGAGTQIVVGWVVDDYDPRAVLIAFMAVATAGVLGLAYLSLSPALLLAVLLVVGVGIWGLNPARDMLISEITPAVREGRTFGYLWTANHLTGAFIPTIVGYTADVFGLRQSFGVLALGTVLAAGSVALLYSDRVYVETGEGVRHPSVD
jgi:MFS family permease